MKREDELIQRMEQGDMSAADELIEMFYAEILCYCLWHVPNRFLAEDAVQEIEAAARFSSIKLLMAKLIVIGMGDIWILSGIFFTVLVKTPVRAESAIFYLCFPFLLTGSGCLFMLGHLLLRQFLVGSTALCSGLILTFVFVPGRFEPVFQQSFSAGWIIICALLPAFCVHQFRYIIYRSAYTEMQVA